MGGIREGGGKGGGIKLAETKRERKSKEKRKKKRAYICRTHNATNLFHRIKIRTQTTMHSEYLLIDDSSDRQAVEAVGERLP